MKKKTDYKDLEFVISLLTFLYFCKKKSSFYHLCRVWVLSID